MSVVLASPFHGLFNLQPPSQKKGFHYVSLEANIMQAQNSCSAIPEVKSPALGILENSLLVIMLQPCKEFIFFNQKAHLNGDGSCDASQCHHS